MKMGPHRVPQVRPEFRFELSILPFPRRLTGKHPILQGDNEMCLMIVVRANKDLEAGAMPRESLSAGKGLTR